MLQVLHLAHDHASVRRLREQLSSRPNERHMWLVCGGSSEGNGVRTVGHSDPVPEEWRLATWDAIVVHRMRAPTPRWLLSIPQGPMVVWATWGDDYYRVFPSLSKGIYLPKSRLLLGVIGKFSVTLLGLAQGLRTFLFPSQWMLTPRDWELKGMARIDGISTLFQEQFVALPLLPKRPVFFYSTWYNGVPVSIPEMKASSDMTGPILLGSSASTSGNQLDFLLEQASAVRASGRSVRMVMAYGSGRYAKALQVIGRWKLGHQLEWLDRVLPLEEYIGYLAECPVVVHNQVRNQNTGNAVLSFLLGHRVLMRSETHLYQYFTSVGFRIADASARKLDFSPLPEEDRIWNRKLALEHFGERAIRERFEPFISDLKRR